MKYDFEKVIKRYGVGSNKWNEMKKVDINIQDNVIPFSVADMEFVTAPEIRESIKYAVDNMVLGYANATEEYKETVCNWMKKRHNWNAKPEWILETHGIVDAFFTAVKAFTKENEGVMLLTPVYYPMYKAIKNNNRLLVDCPLVYKDNKYTIDFEDFEKKAKDPNTKIFILCSPHNPCSRVWTKEELEKMAKICLENNVLVISDEIHFDLIMPGHKHIVFASLSEEIANNCMICTAPSKTFNLAGLQTSNIFIPNEELRKKYLKEVLTTCANPKCNILGYQACKAAYNNCEEWLEQVIEIIYTNKKIIEEFFTKEFPQIKIIDLEGTYLLWMDWNGLGLHYKELERINKKEAHLFFDEGYIFGKQGEGFERWNLACPTKYIYEALDRMKVAYSKYVK